MTTALAIRSIIELAVILLLLYGIAKEEKLIAFEQKVYRIVYVNYRRYVRKKHGIPLRKRNTAPERKFQVYEKNAHRTHGEGNFVA